MAYGDKASLEQFVGTEWVSALATHDSSSVAGDVYDKARADADAEIDAALANYYIVPFGSYGGSPGTPALVHTISNYLTAANLAWKRHTEAAQTWYEHATTMLERIRNGMYEIPGADKVPADEGRIGLSYKVGSKSKFAGYDEDNTDTSRMDGW